jgi:hypothetical protein
MEKQLAKPRIASPKSAKELLDMYFLDMRSAILETGAAMDRLERSEGGDDIASDPRLQKLFQSLDIIKNHKGTRTEDFLKLFSEK